MSEGKSPVLWIALGCGILLLLTVCVGVGAAGVMYWGVADDIDDEAIVPNVEPIPVDPIPSGPVDLEPPPPLVIAPLPVADRTPRRIQATVTRAEGSSGVSVGQNCSFDVTIHEREGGYWCRALANCGGVSLYGVDRPDGTGNGYFPCAASDNPRGVVGEDREMSASDSDGFFHIDTVARRFVVMDDATSSMHPGAYRVEAAIQSVQ